MASHLVLAWRWASVWVPALVAEAVGLASVSESALEPQSAMALGLVLEVGLASASEPALHPESAMALGLTLVVGVGRRRQWSFAVC